MKEKVPVNKAKEYIWKNSFSLLIIGAFLMAFWVKGVVFAGMFMGIMSAIAIWIIVMKLPKWVRVQMGKHVLLSDLGLSLASFTFLSSIGAGVTVFAAGVTNAAILSVLLHGLKYA
jgi:hypothetical protein